MKNSRRFSQDKLRSFFLTGLLVFLLLITIYLFSPYMRTIFFSSVLYVLLRPLYKKIINALDKTKKHFERKRRILAAVFAIGTIAIVATIIIVTVALSVGQVREFSDEVIKAFSTNDYPSEITKMVQDAAERIYELSRKTIDLRGIDLLKEAKSLLSQYSNSMLDLARRFATNIGSFFLGLAFMCFSLYFFYADGDYLAGLLVKALPIKSDDSKKILAKFTETISGLFKGFFLVALFQAATAFVLFLIFRVKGSIILTLLIFLASFVPLLGCGVIWVPVAIIIYFTRSKLLGIIFFIVAGVSISLLDNILRPLFLRDRINIHPLLIFFSILGGVHMLGVIGIVLGPIIVILFFTVIELVLGSDTEEQITSNDEQVANPD